MKVKRRKKNQLKEGIMSKATHKTEPKSRYFSDNLFSLMAELAEEIEALPSGLQKRLNGVADQLLSEVYSQAKFERSVPVTRRPQ